MIPATFSWGHAAHGFCGRPPGHGPGVPGDLAIRGEVQVWIVQLAVHVLPWQTALPTVVDDGEDLFGCSHRAYLPVLAIRIPVALRHVRGFPARGLLWRLRGHRTRIP